MKKIIIPMLMLCIGHASMMRAADTDISVIDNVIYVESFEASAGTKALGLSIKMKNTAAIRGFQFDLVLPEGVTPVEDGGEYVYWLNGDRAPKNPGGQFYHTLEVIKQTDGSYRFLSGAQQDKTFTGSDGEVAVIQVDIAAGMSMGDYSICLKNIKLTETDISKYYSTDEVQSTLTITASSDGRTILDETSTTMPSAAANVNVRVKRTIKANEWSTICLPFAMTEAQVKSAFGNDVQLGDFNSWTSEEEGGAVVAIKVGFSTVTAIEANHPYIIKVSAPVTEFTVDGVDIDAEDKPTVQIGKKAAERGYFFGTYTKTTVPEENLFLSGNRFWYSTGNTLTKGLRGYFEFRDVLDAYYDATAARITMSFDEDTTTGISAMEQSASTSDHYYDLQGRPVTISVKKGIYLKKGKKIVVK